MERLVGNVGRGNLSPEVLERPVHEFKLGGPSTRVCRGALRLPRRRFPVFLGDMFGEVSTLSRSCVLGKVLPAAVHDIVCTREMLQSRDEKS